MMDRRAVLAGIAAIVAMPRAAQSQPAPRVHRVGWLGMATPKAAEHLVNAFEEGLRERGLVIGKNLVIDYRWAGGEYGRLPSLASELVRLQPDVIVAGTMATVRAAKGATNTIPIVMVTVSDPIGEGLISSLARPGGNVTGLTLTPTWAIYGKQLQLLKETVPTAKRIAFLWSPANVAAPPGVKTVEEAARSLGVELHIVGARAPDDFEQAFRTMVGARTEALLVLADGMFFGHRARLAELAIAHRLPTVFASREYAEAGGLMSYGTSSPDLFRRAAIYVDKILKGSKPAELAVEEATKFDLVINLRTAKALPLTIPPSLLARADQIIE